MLIVNARCISYCRRTSAGSFYCILYTSSNMETNIRVPGQTLQVLQRTRQLADPIMKDPPLHYFITRGKYEVSVRSKEHNRGRRL